MSGSFGDDRRAVDVHVARELGGRLLAEVVVDRVARPEPTSMPVKKLKFGSSSSRAAAVADVLAAVEVAGRLMLADAVRRPAAGR